MPYTFRVDYLPDMKAGEVLKVVDKVISAVQEHGVTEEELRQAKVNFRSSFLESLEGGIIPGFGRSDLLAALALYDDDPNRINTILGELDKVTAADVQQAAKRYLVPPNPPSLDPPPPPHAKSLPRRRSAAASRRRGASEARGVSSAQGVGWAWRGLRSVWPLRRRRRRSGWRSGRRSRFSSRRASSGRCPTGCA